MLSSENTTLRQRAKSKNVISYLQEEKTGNVFRLKNRKNAIKTGTWHSPVESSLSEMSQSGPMFFPIILMISYL